MTRTENRTTAVVRRAEAAAHYTALKHDGSKADDANRAIGLISEMQAMIHNEAANGKWPHKG